MPYPYRVHRTVPVPYPGILENLCELLVERYVSARVLRGEHAHTLHFCVHKFVYRVPVPGTLCYILLYPGTRPGPTRMCVMIDDAHPQPISRCSECSTGYTVTSGREVDGPAHVNAA